MYGKLLGTAGVGLFMIAVWIGCGVFAAYATQGAIADIIRPALDPLTSPGTIIAMIYFFVVGYVAIAILFLAIGAMSDSMRDAQGYLMPVLLRDHPADLDSDAGGARRQQRRRPDGGADLGADLDSVRACLRGSGSGSRPGK